MALSVAATTPLRAEVGEITVAQQYGVSFLPLMMMQADKLVEKHAAAAGYQGPRRELGEARRPERDERRPDLGLAYTSPRKARPR